MPRSADFHRCLRRFYSLTLICAGLALYRPRDRMHATHHVATAGPAASIMRITLGDEGRHIIAFADARRRPIFTPSYRRRSHPKPGFISPASSFQLEFTLTASLRYQRHCRR